MATILATRSASTLTVMDFSVYPGAGGYTAFAPTQNGGAYQTINQLSVDIATFGGSTPPGRWESSAYSAGDEVHFYLVRTLASTFSLFSSLASPGSQISSTLNNAGTFPWSYLSSVVLDGSANIPDTRQAGDLISYKSQSFQLVSGTATTSTSVNLASVVPAVAQNIHLQWSCVNTGTSRTHQLGFESGKFPYTLISPAGAWAITNVVVPNVGQAVHYKNDAAGGQVTISVTGYTVPLL